MAVTFADEVALPEKEKDNEFRDVIAYLAANKGAIKSYVVSEATAEKSYERAAVDKRKMTEAGNELAEPRTVRTTTELLDDGKSVKVYINVMEYKIHRGKNKKPVAAATAATTKNNASSKK
jgi:hypothetical protein